MKSNNKLSCGTEDVACSLREVIVHFCSESESHSSILCPVSSSWSWSQSISVWEAVLNTNSDKPFRCSVIALLSLRAPAVLILSFCKASKRDLSLEIFEGRFISGFPMFFWLFVLGQSFWCFCCFFFFFALSLPEFIILSVFSVWTWYELLELYLGNCSSALLTCFYLSLHCSLSSPLSKVMLLAPLWLNPDLLLDCFSWISIWQVINGHCAACVTGVMSWKETLNLVSLAVFLKSRLLNLLPLSLKLFFCLSSAC